VILLRQFLSIKYRENPSKKVKTNTKNEKAAEMDLDHKNAYIVVKYF
jgi:hypothetical protein